MTVITSCGKDNVIPDIPEEHQNPLLNTVWSTEYTGSDEYGNVVSYLFMLGFQEDEASLSMTQIVVGTSGYGMLSYFLPYDYIYNSDTR